MQTPPKTRISTSYKSNSKPRSANNKSYISQSQNNDQINFEINYINSPIDSKSLNSPTLQFKTNTNDSNLKRQNYLKCKSPDSEPRKQTNKKVIKNFISRCHF